MYLFLVGDMHSLATSFVTSCYYWIGPYFAFGSFVTWTKQGVWNIPQRFGPYWCDSITQCRSVWFPSMMQIYYSTTFQRFSVGLFDCCTDRPVNWRLCLFAANAPIAENIFEDNLQIKFNYINKKQKKKSFEFFFMQEIMMLIYTTTHQLSTM